MLSLEQIQTLEAKVETAISKINALTQENELLKTQLAGYQQDQQQIAQIEQGILHALDRLGSVESTIHGLVSTGTEAAESADTQQDMCSAPYSANEQESENAPVNEPQQFDSIY